MKSSFTTVLLLVTAVWLVVSSWPSSPTAPNEAPENRTEDTMPDHVREYHKHKRLYMSGSLSADDVQALKRYGIRRIIRLNGDGKDAGNLSRATEESLCKSAGMEFHYFNIEGDPIRAAQEIATILDRGDALIHCKHGKHRAPAMAAWYLQQSGYSCTDILPLVGWQSLYPKPGKYSRYTELLYCGNALSQATE